VAPTLFARLQQKLRRDGVRATATVATRRLMAAIRRRANRLQPSRPPPPGLTRHIERFSYFHGVLQIRGWVKGNTPVVRLVLRLPTGLTCRITPRSRAEGGARIDQALRVDATPLEMAGAELWVWLADGGPYAIGDLGLPGADPAHAITGVFVRRLREAPAGRLLEIGARARSGVSRREFAPEGWTYEGLDILAGPNVDTVGDAHELSRIYPPASFDAVMSVSVFEHLLMPWKVVVELNRVLKPGAIGLLGSHQTWPLHDTPWDFWRFSDHAWRGLLNPATGFEILEVGMGEPTYVVPKRLQPALAWTEESTGALASVVLFRKIGETQLSWPVELSDVLDTSYPPGELP